MSIPTRQPLHLGLIGYPLSHSLSPLLHQAALDETGLAGDYRLYPVPPLPEGTRALQRLLARMRVGQIRGLNITIPHKQTALEYVDELTSAASAIGAVNTIFAAEDRLVGDNTDAPGFKADLCSQLDIPSNSRSTVVLGAGGSARAIVYALLQDGWQVSVAARRIQQARDLVEHFERQGQLLHTSALAQSTSKGQLKAIDINSGGLADYLSRLSSFDTHNILIVNATPVGMAPQVKNCPWPTDIPFPQGAFVYDLVYNPTETVLVSKARAQGVPATTGLGMLVEQAALAFERWTGYPVSREAMRAAVANHKNGHTISSNPSSRLTNL